MNQIITLHELEIFDARPQKNGNEARFLCCLSSSCREKPRDAAHRSLCVNLQNGFYFCHRCGTKGKLQEFREERPKMNKKQLARVKLSLCFSAPFTAKITAKKDEQSNQTGLSGQTEKRESLAEKMLRFQTLFQDSPAENYLKRRGILPEISRLAGCGFAPKWEHWEKNPDLPTRQRADVPIERRNSEFQDSKSKIGEWTLKGTDRRVVFPIYNEKSELVAIHGRAIETDFFNSPKITKGDKSSGVFLVPNALNAKVLAICEGQIDALALWTCGISAVAMIGTSAPDWLMRKLAFRHILIATDADEAGDKAALKLKTELESRAAKTLRLRPRAGKDWAEVLEKQGAENLSKYFAPFASEADDILRLNTAWQRFTEGRAEVARFLANLIENGEIREGFLYEMRRKIKGSTI